VKANDTDPDGDELTISLSTKRTSGIDVALQGQQLRITVLPGAADLSVVFYNLSDGNKEHVVEGKVLVLRISDTAANLPPVANADVERVVIGNSVKIPVTANDLDPDNDPLTVLSVGKPTGGAGTAVVEGNSIRFTPNLPDITEPTAVTFTYTITDGHGHDATGKVTVTVLLEALPRAPFARDDFADTEVDKPVTINVLANDGDPSGGGQPDLTGDPACPQGGEAKRTADDRVNYVPPKGLSGTFRCKYTVINRQGLNAEASIIITVAEAPAGNHIPVVASGIQLQVDLGKVLQVDATQVATDTDPADHLVFVSVDNPLNGKTEIRQNGDSFLYTAPQAGSGTPAAVTINFTISDGHDGNAPGTLTIRLIDPSSTPTTSPAGATPPQLRQIEKSGAVGAPIPVDVVTELHDANPGTTLTLGQVSIDSGPPSQLQVSSGIATVTASAAGIVMLSYAVTNSEGGSASNKIKITVSEPPQGSPPVANDDSMSVPSGGSNSIDLLANDTGFSDTGDRFDIVLNKRPSADFGTVDLQGSQLTFFAAPNASGTVTLSYTLSDGSGFSDTANIMISVKACGESPPATSAASLFTPYQTPISIDLNQYVLSGSIRSVSGAGLTGATGVYTPPANFNGVETVKYIVANGCQHTTEGTLTIDVNQSPVGSNRSWPIAHGDPPLVLRVTDLASDDEPLTITALSGNPSWVSLLRPGSGGNTLDETVISAAPPASASGDYSFTATVTDPGQLTATAHISLTIANQPPTAVPDQKNTEDSSIPIDPTANDTDPEGGQLCIQTISVTTANASEVVYPVPRPDCLKTVVVNLDHGETKLNYTVRDEGGLQSSSTITIMSNRSPTMPDATGATNGAPIVEITLHPTEPDGDRIDVSCNTPADGDGPNPNFKVENIAVDRTSGPDPATNPRVDVTVSVQQPFTPGTADAQFHCTVKDVYGKSAVATVSITFG
jgi:hypothetical protein